MVYILLKYLLKKMKTQRDWKRVADGGMAGPSAATGMLKAEVRLIGFQ